MTPEFAVSEGPNSILPIRGFFWRIGFSEFDATILEKMKHGCAACTHSIPVASEHPPYVLVAMDDPRLVWYSVLAIPDVVRDS